MISLADSDKLKEKPSIFASIRPLALLVEDLAADDVDIKVLVTGSASPHDFSLTIGQAFALNEADLLVWNGPDFERFLREGVKAKDTLALSEVIGESQQNQHDIHAWLNVGYVAKFASTLAEKLKTLMPDKAEKIDHRLQIFLRQIAEQRNQIEQSLTPYQNRPFIVFHDGYSEFVAEFKLNQVASISSASHGRPSAKRMIEIGNKATSARCLLAEKAAAAEAKRYALMYEINLETADLLAEDQDLRSFSHYFNNIAASFQRCLKR